MDQMRERSLMLYVQPEGLRLEATRLFFWDPTAPPQEVLTSSEWLVEIPE